MSRLLFMLMLFFVLTLSPGCEEEGITPNQQSEINELYEIASQYQYRSREAIHELRERGQEDLVIKAVSQWRRDGSITPDAMYHLADSTHPEVIPLLIEALIKSEDKNTREFAAKTLTGLPQDLKPHTKAISESLFDENSYLLNFVVSDLFIKQLGPSSMPQILASLQDPRASINTDKKALEIFHAFGVSGVPGLMAIINKHGHENESNMAVMALYYLQELGPQGSPAITTLMEFLITGERIVQRESLDALILTGALGIQAIQNFLSPDAQSEEALQRQLQLMKNMAEHTGSSTPDKAALAVAILPAYQKDNPDFYEYGNDILERTDHDDLKKARKLLQPETLLKSAASSDVWTAGQAMNSIGLFKIELDKALPLYRKTFSNPRARHWESIRHIRQYDLAADVAVPLITPVLKSKEVRSAGIAADILSEYGPEASDAVPALIHWVKHVDRQYSENKGVYALLKIEGNTKRVRDVVIPLARLAEYGDLVSRGRVAGALINYDINTKEFSKLIEQSLMSKEENAKNWACAALNELKPEKLQAFTHLKKRLWDLSHSQFDGSYLADQAWTKMLRLKNSAKPDPRSE